MIKKTGSPTSPASVAGARGPTAASPTPRSGAPAGVARASASSSAAGVDSVSAAVSEVAAEVRAGRHAESQARVDAVIEKMVKLELGEGRNPRALAARVQEVQAAVGDHPDFARRVHSLLDAALADQ